MRNKIMTLITVEIQRETKYEPKRFPVQTDFKKLLEYDLIFLAIIPKIEYLGDLCVASGAVCLVHAIHNFVLHATFLTMLHGNKPSSPSLLPP